ncbi:MAG TPA: hypothetical protein VHY30_02885 [Verrucomicrobiae bacterium]|jgi:hypothetical protein|nr:hypothetical protein [Verrucomicrobiae bacterium]
MAKDQTVPVGGDSLKADADALAALAKISDYAPANAAFTLTKLNTASDALKEAADAFAQAEADWQTARDENVAAQWTFHNAMLGAKQQVLAQYGDDSDEAQALGLTKKSERAKPTVKAKPAAATAK